MNQIYALLCLTYVDYAYLVLAVMEGDTLALFVALLTGHPGGGAKLRKV